MLQRNFAKVVSLRPLLSRTSLLGDMLESGWLVYTGAPLSLPSIITPFLKEFLSTWSCDESSFAPGQLGCCPSLCYLWVPRSRE